MSDETINPEHKYIPSGEGRIKYACGYPYAIAMEQAKRVAEMAEYFTSVKIEVYPTPEIARLRSEIFDLKHELMALRARPLPKWVDE